MNQKSFSAVLKKMARSLFAKLPGAAFLYVVILTSMAFLGDVHRYFELTTHFRLQYLLLSCGFLPLFLILRAWRWAGLALLCLTINAVYVAPWYLTTPTAEARPEGQKLRLLLSNVLYDNDDYGAVIELAGRELPDLAFFQEVTPRWAMELDILKAQFPHTLVSPSRGAGGMAVFSRIPFVKSELAPLANYNGPAIIAQVNLGGRLVSIVSVHTPPPVSQIKFQNRTEILNQTANYVNSLKGPKAVIGDLNVSMWSPYYRRFIQKIGLLNVREGFGVLPTWPTFLSPMKIPIDHCLVSPDIQVVNVRVGPNVGSDHLPLIVDLAVPQGNEH